MAYRSQIFLVRAWDGVKAKVDFKHDDVVCEYTGETITHEEAESREEKYLDNCPGEEHYKGYIYVLS